MIAERSTSVNRVFGVLRMMREAGLLAPGRAKRILGPRVHDGAMTPAMPNAMWGTAAAGVWTEHEGMVTVFAAIDHATAERVGSHAAKYAYSLDGHWYIARAHCGLKGAAGVRHLAIKTRCRHRESPAAARRSLRWLGRASLGTTHFITGELGLCHRFASCPTL